MMNHIEENQILLKEYHRGLHNHSTMTARSIIYYYMAKKIENDDVGVILSTDLSAAYHTVDHNILIQKLHHYGIRDKELKFIKS